MSTYMRLIEYFNCVGTDGVAEHAVKGFFPTAHALRFAFDYDIMPQIEKTISAGHRLPAQFGLSHELASTLLFSIEGTALPSPYDEVNGTTTFGTFASRINALMISQRAAAVFNWPHLHPSVRARLNAAVEAVKRFDAKYPLEKRKADGPGVCYANIREDSEIHKHFYAFIYHWRGFEDELLRKDVARHLPAYATAFWLSSTFFNAQVHGTLSLVSCSHVSMAALNWARRQPLSKLRRVHSAMTERKNTQAGFPILQPDLVTSINGTPGRYVFHRLQDNDLLLDQVKKGLTLGRDSGSTKVGFAGPSNSVLGDDAVAPLPKGQRPESIQAFVTPSLRKFRVSPSKDQVKVGWWNKHFPSAPYPSTEFKVNAETTIAAFDRYNAWQLAIVMANESGGNLVAIGSATKSGNRAIGLLQSLSGVHGDRSLIASASAKGDISELIRIYSSKMSQACPYDDWLAYWFANFLTGYVKKGVYEEAATSDDTKSAHALNAFSFWYYPDKGCYIATPIIQAERFRAKHGFVFQSPYFRDVVLPALQAYPLGKLYAYNRTSKMWDLPVDPAYIGQVVKELLDGAGPLKTSSGAELGSASTSNDDGSQGQRGEGDQVIDFQVTISQDAFGAEDHAQGSMRGAYLAGPHTLDGALHVERCSMCSHALVWAEPEDRFWVRPSSVPYLGAHGNFVFLPGLGGDNDKSAIVAALTQDLTTPDPSRFVGRPLSSTSKS